MASIEKTLLTIAIPTYNRVYFLDQCLKSIREELLDKCYEVEIIVSDNCSTDTTPELVNEYITDGLSILYIRNEENRGADFNIIQCFNLANSKYVLILGDDEFFIKGSLSKILYILRNEKEIGIIHITGKSYDKNFNLIGNLNSNNRYLVYENKEEFLKKVHYNFTFISGNILNKEAYSPSADVSYFDKTFLCQLSWTFDIFLKSKKYIYVEDDILGIGSSENTGNYRLFEVFALNFNKIMQDFQSKGFKKEYIKLINNKLITSFFPDFIYLSRVRKQNFISESPKKLLREIYFSNLLYWIYIVPLLYLPVSLTKYWLYLLNLVNKYGHRFFKRNTKYDNIMVSFFNSN